MNLIYNQDSSGNLISVQTERFQITPIICQPITQFAAPGDTVSFSVVVQNQAGVSFQWYHNNIPVPGATGDSLVIINAVAHDEGKYHVLVTWLLPSDDPIHEISKPAALSLLRKFPPGCIAFWRAENDAKDTIGLHNGTLASDVFFADGFVGKGFNFNRPQQQVKIPASSSLNVGLGGGFTIELWVNPANASIPMPLVEWNANTQPENTSIGTNFWIGEISNGSGQGCLYANICPQLPDTIFFTAPKIVQTGVWQHVALTFDKTTGNAGLFLNGVLVGASNFQNTTPATSSDLYLGCRPSNSGSISFAGMLDEVTIYDRALTNTEINYIYLDGRAGKNLSRPYFLAPQILPLARLGLEYPSTQITTMFGVLPVSFSLAAGTLPDGLIITSSGVIQGSVSLTTRNARFSFTIRATDSTGLYSDQIFAILVLPGFGPHHPL